MIKVVKEDITKLDVDIIVNAANKSLLGGGGVDGAIHRAAGKGLLEECSRLHGCETGCAKMTDGYNLKAKKVIHTVGPVYYGNGNEKEALTNCYLNSLKLASSYLNDNHLNVVTIAFPCISTGIYGYPQAAASLIAINTVTNYLKDNDNINVIFCTFLEDDYEIYSQNLKKLL